MAVDDLNLQVRDEEFLVLIGPSGCGKTTALRIIAGLEEQTSGDIFIGDRLVNAVPPKDRDIAMVFQNYDRRGIRFWGWTDTGVSLDNASALPR